MQITIGKILSAVVAVAYTGFAFCYAGADFASETIVGQFLGLLFIWFAEYMGSFLAPVERTYEYRATPAIMFSIIGWIFLLVLPPLIHFLPGFLLR